MGAIADGFLTFAQPFLDQTDGSLEETQKAFSLAQLCFNLAMLPEESRDKAFADLRESFPMTDEEFEEFRQSVFLPMIRRHEEMFPRMHGKRGMQGSNFLDNEPSPRMAPPIKTSPSPAKHHDMPESYAPCPCNSGKKYKFCCGMKRR